ncbi:MAG: DUF6364 family protein [Flavihumibacter sp.]
MTTKLTLTIEETVIKTAKKYAEKKGRSLSGLVENYLKTLTTEDQPAKILGARVRRLKGAVKLPADFDYKASLGDAIAKRYNQ